MTAATDTAVDVVPFNSPNPVNPRLQCAAVLQEAGDLDGAIAELRLAINEISETTNPAEFQERAMLAINLANIYAASGFNREAGELLAGEKLLANKLYQSIHETGSPVEKREVFRAYTQLRDLHTQVTLVGRPAPEITVRHWFGSDPQTLEDLRGQVVVLEFWATWCKPCQATFPKINKLYNENKERGLRILGLTRHYLAYGGTPEALRSELEFIRGVAESHKLDFPVGVAEDTETQMHYGASGVPTVALIDRKGTVRAFGRFSADTDDPEFNRALQDCLNEAA